MASSDVKYHVKVPLDATDAPTTNQYVIYEQSSGSFVLTGSNLAASLPVVAPMVGITPLGTEQFSVFSRVRDGSQTTLSGSDTMVYTGISDNGGTVRNSEITIQSGSGDVDAGAFFVTKVPRRIQSDTFLSPVESNYTYPGYSPVGNIVEHLVVTRSGNLGIGQKSEFITIRQPGNPNALDYIGSSSFKSDPNNCISGSYNYLKIEHTAFTLNATRMQQITYHFGWYRNNSSKNAEDLRVTAIENMRTPLNELITAPDRVTGSFNSSGDFNLSLYHFNVDHVQHVFKYTLM